MEKKQLWAFQFPWYHDIRNKCFDSSVSREIPVPAWWERDERNPSLWWAWQQQRALLLLLLGGREECGEKGV